MTEPLHYETLHVEDSFELRQYRDLVLAKVVMDGPFETAFKFGGELLKDYLAGNNYKKARLSIQSPIMLQARPDGWEVSCILPSSLTLASVPRPMGERILFEEIKPRPVAVVKFQGRTQYSQMMKKTEELRSWTKNSYLNFGKNSRIVLDRSSIFSFFHKNEIHLEGVEP